MIYLGQFKAGETVRYWEAFNNDQGNAEDPTSPYANLIDPSGTLTAITAPSKQNAKTGLFGGTIDTTGFANGIYAIHVGGTVSTAKTPHTVATFRIIANTDADVMARLGAPAGASVSADIADLHADVGTKASQSSVDTVTNYVDTLETVAGQILTESQSHPTLAEIEASTVLAKEATVAARPTNPLLTNDVRLNHLDADISSISAGGGASLAAIEASTVLAKEATSAAIKAKTDNIPAAPATEANVTAVGNAVVAVGATAAAIKTKTDNLPADPASNTQVNTRLASAGYTAPDNAGISAIKAKTDNLPADPASNTQVNTRLAAASYTAPDNTKIGQIKAKTDLIPANPADVSNIPTAAQVASQVDTTLTAAHGSGQWGLAAPTDQVAYTYTLTRSDNGQPIQGATVWVTDDAAGNNLKATEVTNVNGQVMFFLEPGTYYFWKEKKGFQFTNPETEEVS